MEPREHRYRLLIWRVLLAAGAVPLLAIWLLYFTVEGPWWGSLELALGTAIFSWTFYKAHPDDIHARVWLLVIDPDATPHQRMRAARKVWRLGGEEGARLTAYLSSLIVQRLSQSPAHSHFTPAPPTQEIADQLGPDGEQVSAESWAIVGGAVLSDAEGLADPFLRHQAVALANRAGPAAVLMFAWWGLRAISTLAVEDRAIFPAHMRAIKTAWDAAP